MHPNIHTLGESLRTVRKAKNITQEQLSKKTGLSQQHISKIERNEIMPTLITLLKITNALDLKIDYEPNKK